MGGVERHLGAEAARGRCAIALGHADAVVEAALCFRPSPPGAAIEVAAAKIAHPQAGETNVVDVEAAEVRATSVSSSVVVVRITTGVRISRSSRLMRARMSVPPVNGNMHWWPVGRWYWIRLSRASRRRLQRMNQPVPVAAVAGYVFPPPPLPAVPVEGTDALYAVSRIFCVGRNYAEHAREMGFEVDREAPFYFTKPANALTLSGATIPYPPGTNNYHYEMELVVAIGAPAFFVPAERAGEAVFGYACGLDMTRRDLQFGAREKGRPWDFGKSFEQSAVIGPLRRAAEVGALGPQRLTLAVNGQRRQDTLLSSMVWSVPELIAYLSRFYHLVPGDLIYTGTPAGVGAVIAGDQITGAIDGLKPVELAIAPAERTD
jgi:fumarylpyruvate hydrolase